MARSAVLRIQDEFTESAFPDCGRENSKVLYGNFSDSTRTMTQGLPARKSHLSLVPDKTENQDSTKVLPLFSKEPYRTITGKEFDEQTGLYYFGARYYDPRTSVWQSADKILSSYLDGKVSGGVYNPFTLASYSYVQQNPVG